MNVPAIRTFTTSDICKLFFSRVVLIYNCSNIQMNYSIIVRLSKFQSTTLHGYSAWPTYTNTVACQRASSTTQFYKQHEDIKMDKIFKKK